MRYLKLFENLEENVYQEIQSMIDGNQFLKGKVKADNSTVFEAGDYLLLLGDLSHITDAHVEETIPGSKFNKGVDLKKAIISLVSNNKPTEMTKGFGPSESGVNNTDDAEKFKWLGLESKTDVGVENVQQLDANSEEFKSMNVYTYKDSRGNEFNIKVKQGEGEKTTFLSFIGAKLGKVGDKIVLSVMTAFPGKNGVSIANRNEFINNGLYFTTTSKQVIEMSKGSVVESKINKLKYLKTFESFKVFESIDEEFSVTIKTATYELEEHLSEYVDGLSDYGSGYMIIDKIKYIVYNSLIDLKGEAEAEKIADKFTEAMKEESKTTYNEYDEGSISGSVKYKSNDIFEFRSHSDGYGFSGSFVANKYGRFDALSTLLDDIKGLLQV